MVARRRTNHTPAARPDAAVHTRRRTHAHARGSGFTCSWPCSRTVTRPWPFCAAPHVPCVRIVVGPTRALHRATTGAPERAVSAACNAQAYRRAVTLHGRSQPSASRTRCVRVSPFPACGVWRARCVRPSPAREHVEQASPGRRQLWITITSLSAYTGSHRTTSGDTAHCSQQLAAGMEGGIFEARTRAMSPAQPPMAPGVVTPPV